MKIRNKILLYISIPSMMLFFLLTSYILEEEGKLKEEILITKINSSNKIISSVIAESLWNYDLEAIKDNFDSFLPELEIVKLGLKEENSYLVLSPENITKEEEKEIDIIRIIPVMRKGNKIGILEIGYTRKYIKMDIEKTKNRFYLFMISLLSIVFFAAYFVSKIIYRPVNNIVYALKRVDEGEFDYKLNLKGNDEFKIVEVYFNKMIKNLERGNLDNKQYLENITEKNDELESAYNEMMAINETLADTLKELEISENKYRNMFNYAPDGMLVIDLKNKKIEEFNREFLSIVDVKTIDLMDMLLSDIFYEKDSESIFENLKSEELTYNYETVLKIVDKAVIVSVIPLEYDKTYAQMVIKDITELKKLQSELEQYAKRLENKVKDRTKELEEANEKIKEQQKGLVEDAYNRGFVEVTSGIIHNMGNIINIINLNLEELIKQFPKQSNSGIKFLREIVFSEIQKIENKNPRFKKIEVVFPEVIDAMEEFEGKIKKDFIFLTKKVAHLKEIVQLQQNFVGGLGTEDYNDINEVIKEVIEIYSPSLEKRSILLKENYGESKQFLCDKNQIFQVISNIVKNSYEALEDMQIPERIIEIKTEKKEKKIEIIIKDNGMGISKENLDNIFEFGFSTKKEVGRGSGFGLHSSKAIVSKYGGEIIVSSELGKGTEFKLLFPVE